MKNKKIEKLSKVLTLILAGILIGVTANINAQSGANPTVAPTGGNASAPINSSSTAQWKAGALALGKSSNPGAGLTLDVNGSAIINTLGVINLMVATGTPTAGKVLGSVDSLGTVGWTTLAAQDIPTATTAVLETYQFKWPCPPKIMNQSDNTVYLPNFTATGVVGDAKDSNCGEGRLFADNSGSNQDITSLDAFCQSVGYRAYMSATFYSFDSPGNNKVIKFEPASVQVSKFRFFPANASGNNHIASNITCQRIVTKALVTPDLR